MLTSKIEKTPATRHGKLNLISICAPHGRRATANSACELQQQGHKDEFASKKHLEKETREQTPGVIGKEFTFFYTMALFLH